MTAWRRITPLALLALGAAACGDAAITTPAVEPPAEEAARFSEQLSLPELQESASSAAVRVEVKLRSDAPPLVAREVERADAEDAQKREKIEGRVTAADAQGLTLALGGLRIGFDESTRFRSEGGASLTRDDFLARLQTALTAGRQPSVEAERAAPAQPQAPEDATFLASALEIDDEASEPKLELNVDADNLQLDAGSARAVLTVLGLAIEIRADETEVEAKRAGSGERAKFEGIVASADAGAGTVTLRDGRVIRVVLGTEIETKKRKLASVAEVAAAVAAGQIVEAEGKGIRESATTLVAVEVEFEVEEEADDVPDTSKLEDGVAAVDTVARTVTLSGGQVVRVLEGTRIKGSDGLRSLREVALALAAGRTVEADAKLLLEAAGPPARYIALELKFKVRDEDRDDEDGDDEDGDDEDGDDDDEVEFEAEVASVDVAGRKFTLSDGRVVLLSDAATLEGDLATLEAVAAALAAGQTVVAEGEAVVEAEGPPVTLRTDRVKFEVEDD